MIDAIQLYKKPLGSFYKYDEFGNSTLNIFGKQRLHIEYDEEDHAKNAFNETFFNNYVYDDKGNLRGIIDANDVLTTYDYDRKNNITKQRIEHNGLYMENNSELEKASDQTNILLDSTYDELDNLSEFKYDNILFQIKEFKDKVGTTTQYSYDDWENIKSYIINKSSSSNNVSFTYTKTNQIETIKLKNDLTYKFNYDDFDRLKYVIIDNDSPINLAEYTYDDGQGVITDNVATKTIGIFGDKYEFTYDDLDRVKEVSLHKKNSTEKKVLSQYFYDDFDRLEKYVDCPTDEFIKFEYNVNNQIVKTIDNNNNFIQYKYDDNNNIVIKNIFNNKVRVVQSFDSLNRSKRITPQIFFKEYKNNNKPESLNYSCFFNELTYDKIDKSVKISKNASANHYDSEGIINQKIYSPTYGKDIKPKKDGAISCIECDSSNMGITYNINTIEQTEQSCLTVMFWFKPTTNNLNKSIFTCGRTTEHVGIAIRDRGNLDVFGLGTGNLTTTNAVKYNDWNFVALTVYNRDDGPGYPAISNYEINLNGTKRAFNTKAPQRVYKNLSSNCELNFGHDFKRNGFEGEITGIVFTNNVLVKYTIDEYYNLFKKYVINYEYLDESLNTVETTSTNNYDGSLFDSIDIIPLNNSLESIKNNIIPEEFTEKTISEPDRDSLFDYNRNLKRFVYSPKNNKLIYNFNLSNVGTLIAKVMFASANSKDYVFQNIDTRGRTLGLYKSNNLLYLEVDGRSHSTGLTVGVKTWKVLMLSWKFINNDDPEKGPRYDFVIRSDGSSRTISLELSFKYYNFKTSIGARIVSSVAKDTLNGQIEMLGFSKSAIDSYSYNQIRDKLKVTTYSKEFDAFNFLKKQTLSIDESIKLSNIYTYKTVNNNSNRIAPLVNSETIKTNKDTKKLSYEYDNNNNVIAIKEDDSRLKEYKYTYDGKMQSETLYDSEDVFAYAYDDNGNITSIYKTKFSPGGTTINYEYHATYPDRLIKYGVKGKEKDILYEDAFNGNPTFYGKDNQGIYFTWEGRRLKTYYDNENDLRVDYRYNDQGLRTRKEIINKQVTKYYYEGSSLISEITGSKKKSFLYDEANQLYGLIYNNKSYYYIRDILGTILGIIDKDGTTVVEYRYNAFGELLNITGSLKDTLGKENPFIYKGYYYDFETGLYYCKSRYYNPKWCRWLNADDVSYLDPESINGLNLYAYCKNNPVMNFDPTGKFAISLTVLGLIVGAVIGATAGGVVAYNVAKNNGAEGWELFGWTMSGIVGGGIIGGTLGAGIGALITKATGVVGLSITKYSIIPIKSVTVLGNIPTYSTAAIATGSGYYQISNQLYNSLSSADRLANNLQYIADANSLGSQFAIIPEYVIKSGYTLWEELNYLIQNGIPYIIH